MQIYIDTCIWIDFLTIGALELPFKLNCECFMSSDAMREELLSPERFGVDLLEMGLKTIDLDNEELLLVYEIAPKYPKLSTHDVFALAITKQRQLTLLTGDKNLRQAADIEGVAVRGTLWILDELFSKKLIALDTYRKCLIDLSRCNGGVVRLPCDEIQKRIDETVEQSSNIP